MAQGLSLSLSLSHSLTLSPLAKSVSSLVHGHGVRQVQWQEGDAVAYELLLGLGVHRHWPILEYVLDDRLLGSLGLVLIATRHDNVGIREVPGNAEENPISQSTIAPRNNSHA